MGLIAYGVIALAIIGSLGGLYYKVNQDGVVAGRAEVQAKWDDANKKARAAEAAASAKAAADLEAERKKRRVVIREVTNYVDKIIDRPVYRNVCLDPDGLRCVNAAILGTDAAGCKPDSALPTVKPPG